MRKGILLVLMVILSINYLSAQKTENLKMFEPEFYAYRIGRLNNENGEGKGWYKRFCIFHITDVHNYKNLLSEAINSAQSKANIIINTGDNGNGCKKESAPSTIACLESLMDTVVTKNKENIPYLDIPGNHDVPGLKKEEYFQRVGSVIQKYSPTISWGDSSNFRSYGYLDIKTDEQMGTFRIIMLDPFDYDDGDFDVKRKFMSATFSQKQINWLIATLKDVAGLSNYHIITIMHYPFGDNELIFNEEKVKPDAEFYQDPFMIPDIIDAVQHKSTLNRTYKDKLEEKDIIVNEDFSEIGDIDYVCHLFGHIHGKNEHWCQKTNGSKKYDILMLGESSLGAMGTLLNKVYREPGTVNEIEFSALAIDTKEKNIYRISYGAYLKYDMSNSARTEKISYRLK